MSESFNSLRSRQAAPGLALILCLAAATTGAAIAGERGQYGGDMGFLRQFHTAPGVGGESNHYIDLWEPGLLPLLARAQELTNCNALFVDSHARSGCSRRGTGFGFYPKEEMLAPRQKRPYFAAADFASLLGPEAAARVHNIVLAGCNEDGRFDSREMRRHFPNATNVIYMAPGHLAYKPMFRQILTRHSSAIIPLYGKERNVRGGRIESEIYESPVRGARPLGAFVADLYRPGEARPYVTQRAGRELLDEASCAGRVAATDMTALPATALHPTQPPADFLPPIIITRESAATPKPAAVGKVTHEWMGVIRAGRKTDR